MAEDVSRYSTAAEAAQLTALARGGATTWTAPNAAAFTTVLVVNDHQIPYHDRRSVAAVHEYAKDIQPTIIILLGDVLDFPSLTTKFLRSQTERGTLMRDIQLGRELLTDLREKCPLSRIIYIEGNHEARLRNYIIERADELEGLTSGPLSLPALLNIPGLEYIEPYGEHFEYKSFLFTHGTNAGRYAADKELQTSWTSGMSGHTHRLQVHSHSDRRGPHAWYSNMCLCYTKGRHMPPGTREGEHNLQNWQQGFSTIYFSDLGFNVYQTVITERGFIAPGGKEYVR